MWNFRYLGATALGCLSLIGSQASAEVLHTSSRWIVDANNQRVKLRCVNWAGHMETNIPEGLNHQSASTIAAWIANNGFNCVRLTYSIDMALNPDVKVSDSFASAASAAGVSASDMTTLYQAVESKNSWISSATTQGAFAQVLQELAAHNVLVILDNHVSKASWCCGTSDGNGWWASASGYNADNSRYFDTDNWLKGLAAMAAFAKSHANVVGMSLRNELRAVGSQDGSSHADWYSIVPRGAASIHDANADLLIVIGGVSYATDMSFLGSKPLDRSPYGDKVVWEFHNYQWSFSTNDCSKHQSLMGQRAGYLLTQGKDYTGPLWLSEFGWNQASTSGDEWAYITCLRQYMEGNDADWAYWGIMGSYYVRQGKVDLDETFGLLNHDWSAWRNTSFHDALGKMWDVTQGP